MKIMSFNILCGGAGERDWKPRREYVTETIKKYAPDSFGVQEAHYDWMKVLIKELPEYSYFGVGRDDGEKAGEFSAVFYLKNKFDLTDSGNFWLSETPDKPGLGWDAACVRICSWAALKENETGKEFVHFNTHLDHIGAVAMQKGAELVTIKAKQLSPDKAAVFTGDFNVTPQSAPYKAVIEGGFLDARNIAAVSDDSCTFHTTTKAPLKEDTYMNIIDYIFVKGNVKVNSFKVIKDSFGGSFPSDHFPVISEMEIN